jgi:uncharacterized 2Fe-2S/4Fe-4S cluster protein (DUF4445 family)
MPDLSDSILHVFPGGIEVRCRPGETYHRLLAPVFPSLAGTCGGRGSCGRCRILIDPAPLATDDDRRAIPVSLLGLGWRLACRHVPDRSASVHLLGRPRDVQILEALPLPPAAAPLVACLAAEGGFRVLSGRRLLDRLAGRPGSLLTAAIDIGTTSISVELVDLLRPASLGTASFANPQASSGADILSRYEAARRPGGLEELRSPLLDTVGAAITLLLERARLGSEPVWGLVAAGNPVMSAIFAGRIDSANAWDLWSTLPERLDAAAFPGLRLHPRAPLHLLPQGGGFVGGDMIAGLLHTAPSPPPTGSSLLVDLGTNGEIALQLADGRILAASTAAGPALEGSGLSCGMRATEGAIDSAWLGSDLEFTVIGGGVASGICGSGALDLLACMVRTGLVLEDGRFLSAAEASHLPWKRLAARRREIDGETVFAVSEGAGGTVALTQGDVRNLQLALGAIKAGLKLLLESAGADMHGVGRMTLAGAFGSGLRRETLAALGVIPDGWQGRLEFAGNGSLAGARDCLLDRRKLGACRKIARRLRVLDLVREPSFRDAFLRGMRLGG